MLDNQYGLQPRAKGSVTLSSKQRGAVSVIDDLHQSGCLRLLFPLGGAALDAVLINTSGGVTGGDRISVAATIGAGSELTLTTQAAERAYRAQPDQIGQISTTIKVAAGGVLNWLPQELLLFNGCCLHRNLDVALADDAKALLVEPVVFGRSAMGETLTDIAFRDRIAVTRVGHPIYRDGVTLSGNVAAQLVRSAIGQGMIAMANIIYAAPDAHTRLPAVRALMPATGGASLLAEDLLVGRIMAADSYLLRCALIPIIEQLSGAAVPRTWRL
ncbi:MAG: urease accessory protein [Yoonia sp.]|jgi:urease accessory protein